MDRYAARNALRVVGVEGGKSGLLELDLEAHKREDRQDSTHLHKGCTADHMDPRSWRCRLQEYARGVISMA
eukprot:12424183-Karenia_brevis.AAC.2